MPPNLHPAMGFWEPCAALPRLSTPPPCAADKPPHDAQSNSNWPRASLFLLFLPMGFAFFGFRLIRPFAAKDGYYGLC